MSVWERKGHNRKRKERTKESGCEEEQKKEKDRESGFKRIKLVSVGRQEKEVSAVRSLKEDKEGKVGKDGSGEG